MFQLIVAVIAIVLVVALVLAALWFGGSTYSEAKLRALHSEYLNNAAQISGAMQLYFNDHVSLPPGEDAVLIQGLVDSKYLKNSPPGTWKVSANNIFRRLETEAQCEPLNRLSGFDTSETPCPPCDDAAYKLWPGCTMESGE